jgi:preprotein translocase subunit SecY
MAFRVFRLLVGLSLGAVSIWLIGDGGSELLTSLRTGVQATEALVEPVLKVVAGLVILGLYYYSFWGASPLRRALENIFSVPDLLKKIAFTLALLCIYRIGFHIPLPGIDQDAIAEMAGAREETSGFGQAIAYFNMFTGGNLERCTLFGLGIMPYISASIIFTLLTTVVPALEKLQKEGPAGHRKIQEYTRYATVVLCLIQATVWMRFMLGSEGRLVFPEYRGQMRIFLMGIVGLTAGTIFLMWLGEQIDEYGVGNGISLLIMAGILARFPGAVGQLSEMTERKLLGEGGEIGLIQIIFLVGAFIFVVAGAILITQGQRRIPIQQAKHTRGRRVYGGQRQYMPLRVNHGGVMPIIFASALMIFPGMIFGALADRWSSNATLQLLQNVFRWGGYIYAVCYIVLIFFFAYFWTTVQFRPKDMADQLRDMGHFIPGLRPGRRTADYLERVMGRITYCGAAFLSAIAVIPMVVTSSLGIPFGIAAFLGGTGLLITVSVALDLVQRIEANLVMRNYGGFLGGSTRIRGAYG